MVETRNGVVFRWAMELPLAEAARAAALRHVRGVEGQVVADRFWLHGSLVAEDEQELLRLLPGVRPYLVAADGQLTLVGDRVPSARLPNARWQPLAELLHVQIPEVRTTIAGRPTSVPLRLIRGGTEREATMLLTTLDAWARYADTAPQWRLECLAFAADRSGRVMLRGTPLPPIRGEPWVECGGIAAPAGWTWQPELEPAVLRPLFGLEDGDVALLSQDRYVVIRSGDWVRATRSAVRMTAAAIRRS